MEKDLKRIEWLIERCNQCKMHECIECEICWSEVRAIENLLKSYRNLQYKLKEKICFEGHQQFKELQENSIPKSKIKEMIEYYKKLGDEFYEKFLETNKTDIDIHDAGISCDAKARVLQELLED